MQRSENLQNHPTSNLSVGRVKWFGGNNKQTGKSNPYGFISDGSHKDLFVHKNKLACTASDLQEGIHVVFEEQLTEKGREAHSVRLLKAEKNQDVLESLLSDSKIPLAFRLRVLVRFSDPVGSGITKLLSETVKEALNQDLDIGAGFDVPVSEDDKSRLALGWPESWLDCELDGEVFNAMPSDFKQFSCRKHYSVFLEKLDSLSRTKTTAIKARMIYKSLDESDFALSQKWCGVSNNDFELAKMISARGAELAAKYFYENAGNTAVDTALQQIHGGKEWLTHDLRLNDHLPVDVKNARQSSNASVLVEYTVPKFKQDRNSTDVRICAILSPYARLDWIKDNKVKDDIVFLGETSRDEIDELISRYHKPDQFELDNRFKDKLPVWLFNIPKSFSDNKLKNGFSENEAEEFPSTIPAPKAQHWPLLPNYTLPGCIAIGIDLPKPIERTLPKWEKLFIASLKDRGPPTLGNVYLAVLSHFFSALKHMAVAEENEYAPSRYWELLYLKKPTRTTTTLGPLGIIDPLGVVASLIASLELLWARRSRLKLAGVRSLRVSPEGLVTGRFNDWGTKTILAYCGGRLDGKGRCGYSPLVLGEHDSCQACGKLKCPKCDYCSPQCDKG